MSSLFNDVYKYRILKKANEKIKTILKIFENKEKDKDDYIIDECSMLYHFGDKIYNLVSLYISNYDFNIDVLLFLLNHTLQITQNNILIDDTTYNTITFILNNYNKNEYDKLINGILHRIKILNINYIDGTSINLNGMKIILRSLELFLKFKDYIKNKYIFYEINTIHPDIIIYVLNSNYIDKERLSNIDNQHYAKYKYGIICNYLLTQTETESTKSYNIINPVEFYEKCSTKKLIELTEFNEKMINILSHIDFEDKTTSGMNIGELLLSFTNDAYLIVYIFSKLLNNENVCNTNYKSTFLSINFINKNDHLIIFWYKLLKPIIIHYKKFIDLKNRKYPIGISKYIIKKNNIFRDIIKTLIEVNYDKLLNEDKIKLIISPKKNFKLPLIQEFINDPSIAAAKKLNINNCKRNSFLLSNSLIDCSYEYIYETMCYIFSYDKCKNKSNDNKYLIKLIDDNEKKYVHEPFYTISSFSVINDILIYNKYDKILFPNNTIINLINLMNTEDNRNILSFNSKLKSLYLTFRYNEYDDNLVEINLNRTNIINYLIKFINSNERVCFIHMVYVFYEKDNKNINGSHAVLLCLDKDLKQSFIFDPDTIFASNADMIKNALSPIIQFLSSNKLPFLDELYTNIQKISKKNHMERFYNESGYCNAFSSLFPYIYLNNRNIILKNGIHSFMKDLNKELENINILVYIRKFVNEIYKKYIDNINIYNINITNRMYSFEYQTKVYDMYDSWIKLIKNDDLIKKLIIELS